MAGNRIRKSVIAGSWYPGEKDALSVMLEGFLMNAEKQNIGFARVLVAPHAGYLYSGQVAAYAYKQIQGMNYKKVIVLAPTHHVRFDGASIVDKTHFRTPLGDVEVAKETFGLSKKGGLIHTVPLADEKEHSLEIQLPFLQKVLDKFELVPLIIGNLEEKEVDELATELMKIVDDETLIVASTDLSHFYPYDQASEMDNECIDAIVSLNIGKAEECEMCGKNPVLIAMAMAKKMSWKTRLLKYKNSGDVTGDHTGVVGYASIVFYSKNQDKDNIGQVGNAETEGALNKEEKIYLLKLARNAMEAYVKSGDLFVPDEVLLDKRLRTRMAAFVTLQKNGQLRGCIGHLNATEPLYLDVRDNAINAAVHDPRFPEVTEDELGSIEIEISVLSAPEVIKVKNPDEYLEKIRPKVDGIILEYNGRGATYLPQVWEQLPDKEEFLESLCLKANLPADSWKKTGAKLFRYTVEAFKESD
jgi:AmmeMemoRadiSam system protein B/AmmeMemoRadiSam system protein A